MRVGRHSTRMDLGSVALAQPPSGA
ncbi:hypothetical protein LINPERHAP1_LOCUS41392 [Linum perenne]